MTTQVSQRKYWEQGWKGNITRQQEAKKHWGCLAYLLKEQIDLKPGDKILDIGCGCCGMINCLNIGKRYGLDPLLDYYLSNFDMPKDIEWVKGTGESLPFEDGSFDVVISTDTLDHIDDPGQVLGEIRRVLKEGGFLFLIVNIHTRCTKLIKDIHRRLGIGSPTELHTFTTGQVELLFHRLGFRITSRRLGAVDLEIVTGTSTSTIRKALEIKRESGLGEGLKFILSSLTGGRSYQGDLVILATRNPEVMREQVKYPKILFVPSNSRHITQFSLVRHELEANWDSEILAITSDKKMELLLQENGFSYKHIKDYRTWNTLNIIKEKKPDIVVTTMCGFLPKAFILAANHLGVPCLQIDDGITGDFELLKYTFPIRVSLRNERGQKKTAELIMRLTR